jgi:2-polyprenyl-3-methyl-5-hydroxy-6-metoxy-1,4-benzoquinol methylase
MIVYPTHRGIDIPNGAGYLPHIIYHLVRYKFVKGFIKPTDEIMDIACGTGYGTRMLSDYCKTIVGIDINKDTIDYAVENYGGENREYHQGSILEIKGQYDIIVCYETIEHINKEEGVLAVKNLKECLKPNGILFISTPKKLPTEELSSGRAEFHKFEYTYEDFKVLLSTFFERPIIFSQTDEIITIGNYKAVWTYIGMCWNN